MARRIVIKTMTEERLSRLRHEMNAEGIDAIIFPTGDPHGSEYVAPYWQARQWITGFTGSAGTAVVTQDEAALWTDSRYFLQAAQQLQGTGFTLMKDGLADTPSITEWLMRKMSAIACCRRISLSRNWETSGFAYSRVVIP